MVSEKSTEILNAAAEMSRRFSVNKFPINKCVMLRK